MDLNTLANLAEIAGVLIVIGGFGFAVIQILQFRKQRSELAAIELVRSFANPEFAHALHLVLSLPSGVRAEKLRQRDSRYEDAAWLVGLTLESVGVMVDRRIVTTDMVYELMGGVSQSVWEKLSGWVEDLRREQGQDKYHEWMERLAMQMKQHAEETGAAPAYRRQLAPKD